MRLTGNTIEMLRYFVKMTDRWARLLNIWRCQSINPGGREYHLITMMGLQEAGERCYDFNGGNPDVSVNATGYSRSSL